MGASNATPSPSAAHARAPSAQGREHRRVDAANRAILRFVFAFAALAVSGIAFAQSIKVPDFRHNPPPVDVAPRPGESCERCGVIRSIRETEVARPVAVPQAFQSAPIDQGPGSVNYVGAIVVLPLSEGSGRSYVGGVGTPEMRERFSETSYEVTVRLDNGSYTVVQRRDGASFRVGDRVRVEGIQLTLLAP